MPWLARFQSTRPYGARPGAPARRHRPPYRFNPRARTGRAASCGSPPRRGARFNPRARTGRDHGSDTHEFIVVCFNPRARTGRDPRGCAKTAHRAGFNPRARTGRDSPLPLHRSLSGVSIHAPARGATKDDGDERGAAKFQSMRPHGARLGIKERNLTPAQFQSTRPHGARRRAPVGIASGLQFQSTRPHGARHPLMSRMHKPDPFQSTRPHGARPHACDHSREHRHVSIHAPARGATRTNATSSVCWRCFNPRARTGRDRGLRRDSSRRPRFNPRARTGRDLHRSRHAPLAHRFNPRARTGRDLLQGLAHLEHAVSIHAPARGATRRSWRASGRWWSFNPRARTGRDPKRWRRRRPSAGFNPRARTGRDMTAICSQQATGVSIHAPARGATKHFGVVVPVQLVSIHAPARGATCCCGSCRSTWAPFQSTRPHGARPGMITFLRGRVKFQSTRPHGARPGRVRSIACHWPFQSTRPHGARPAGPATTSISSSFNPRARTGRDASRAVPSWTRSSFNPRARTGRDRRKRREHGAGVVSIHAPARGATIRA